MCDKRRRGMPRLVEGLATRGAFSEKADESVILSHCRSTFLVPGILVIYRMQCEALITRATENHVGRDSAW